MDESIKNAIDAGCPQQIAEAIQNRLNNLAAAKAWVPLHKETPRFSISRIMKQGTSIITYWGPKHFLKEALENAEFIEYLGDKYHQISRSKASKLSKSAEAVKMHEVVLGSSFYPSWVCPNCRTRNLYTNKPTQLATCKNCNKEIPKKLQKSIDNKRPSLPKNSRVWHRHWEITELWKKLQKRNLTSSFIKGEFP